MGSDNAFRASDADRDRVVEVLRDAYASGRLSLAEFDSRASAALTGRTWGDLRILTSDLPMPPQRVPLHLKPPARPHPGALPGGVGPLPVLPIAVLWLAVTVAVRAPDALIPIVFFLMVALKATVRIRGGPDGGPSSRDRGGPSHRAGGTR